MYVAEPTDVALNETVLLQDSPIKMVRIDEWFAAYSGRELLALGSVSSSWASFLLSCISNERAITHHPGARSHNNVHIQHTFIVM